MKVDKAYHFIAGFLLGVLFGIFHWSLGVSSALVAGIIKEWRDERVYGGWDWYDILATVAGGVFAVILLKVFLYWL